ncbi:L-rhamnose mutarotase [Microbacterium sp. ZW CA_36]|uniref:L-rhamnose mutarotase n=1 Tax=Microbacterium sp. ZW CA_36 TaxID=3378078 RepID=UPI0038542E06
MNTVVEGYRTRLRSGASEHYRRVHSQIPAPLHAALTACGMVNWRIWIDGETLFHLIETRDGRERMIERMRARPAVDPAWDALISTLIDDSPNSSVVLPLVWDASAC